jgi:hypothetical protein
LNTLQNISIFTGGLTLLAAVLLMVKIDLRDALNGHINHSRSLKWKILSCAIPGVCFLIPLWNNSTWWMAGLVSLTFTASWFSFLFNGTWGLKVAEDWFYRSTAKGKSKSRFDKLVQSWPKKVYIAVMCLETIGVTVLYIFKL